MALELDFKIDKNTTCSKLKLTDITCEYNTGELCECETGYGFLSNIRKNEIGSTCFNWILPNYQSLMNVDLGWVPGLPAYATFSIDAGIEGVIVVCIGGKEVGKAIYSDGLDKLAEAVALNINVNSEYTGWKAYVTNDTTVTVYNTCTSTQYNGLSLEVLVTDSIGVTVNEALTLGANGEDDSIYISYLDLYPGFCEPNVVPKFEDGVHQITYIVKDSQGEEVARESKNILVDCEMVNCLRNLTKLYMSKNCKCSVDNLSKKVVSLRARLDEIRVMFSEGEVKCVNDSVKEFLEDCHNACLDCE